MGSRNRLRPFVIDSRDYEVGVGASEGDFVDLRLTIRAGYGEEGFCIVRGLRTFHRFRNYGYQDIDGFSENADLIEITPRMIAALVRHALASGWNPELSRTTHEIEISNLEAKAPLIDAEQ